VATGAVPARLGIPGEEFVSSSDEFLNLIDLPERIVFVGGEYVSFEFAHVAVRAGARVTILERLPRPLLQFDADLVDRLVEHSVNLGIDVRLCASAVSVEKRAGGRLLVRAMAGEEEEQFEADLVVHGANRIPNVEALGLEAAEVMYGRAGIEVNEYLQSVSNPAVYAAGDVAATGAPMSSPVADVEGRTAAFNLLEGNRYRADYCGIPRVVFTIPSLAAVGLGVDQARARNLRFTIHQGDRGQWTSMEKVAERTAHFKILVEEDSGCILGAHLLGPDAAEMINMFVLAMRHKLTASDLKSAPFAFPTFCADIPSMF
jgi:glutathione reductase (NADPH)